MRRWHHRTTPLDVLASLLQAVGSEGTLLLPTFNFQFCSGVPFDVYETPSEMGVLSEVARQHPLAVRTPHPIYSFVAIGKEQERFRAIDNVSGYGPDSPFSMLRELDGLIAVIDLPDQESMTYYHHVEEMEKVSYRYHKEFTGLYRGYDRVGVTRTFRLFVRDLSAGVVTSVHAMERLLWDRRIYRGYVPGVKTGMRVAKAAEIHKATAEIIHSGRARGMLYDLVR